MNRLAFFFDSSACSGCKACQVACKDKNDLPVGQLWRRVYEVSGGGWKQAGASWTQDVFAYNLSLSCNHCADPVCATNCPTKAIRQREDGIVLIDQDACIGCKYCAWACPYGVRELDEQQKVMKKCTLCIDRISDQSLPENERRPACVLACPTTARLYGDVHDPDSEVSIAIRENGGYQLMPEWGTQPANHYLPRRKTRIQIFDDELERADNPLKKEAPLPAAEGETLDDVAY